LLARTQSVAEVGHHRVDVQGGFDVMRIWTEVNEKKTWNANFFEATGGAAAR
jgi:hypothetical protein